MIPLRKRESWALILGLCWSALIGPSLWNIVHGSWDWLNAAGFGLALFATIVHAVVLAGCLLWRTVPPPRDPVKEAVEKATKDFVDRVSSLVPPRKY